MNLTDMVIKEDYAEGVNALTGGVLSKDEVLKRLEGISLNDGGTEQDKAGNFCQCTQRLLDTELVDGNVILRKSFEGFSDAFKNGMVESLSQQIWACSYNDAYNPRKEDNPYWIENQITNVFVDILGSRDAVILSFQEPDILTNGMKQIPYGNSNLVDYLNQHIDKARNYGKSPNNLGSIAHSSEVLDCVEALSDCSSQFHFSETNDINGKKSI